jgi:hypothetical protein
MELSTAIEGMLKHRKALDTPQGLSSPTYISEQIQAMAQYVGNIELILADKESDLVIKEAARYKEYIDQGKKTSTAKDLARFDFTAEHAEINKLTRYISSSWKIVSTAQSRILHLIEEAKNQI